MTLESEDGKCFAVPSIIMAVKFPLIRNILKHGTEEEKKHVKFSNISSDVLDNIIQWTMNPNNLRLNLENFSDILVASEYLLCPELSDDVRQWIFSSVDMPENIVTLLKFSQGYMILDLEKQAYNFLTSNISAVNAQELQVMSFHELLALLSSNDISCSEEELWFTVLIGVQLFGHFSKIMMQPF